jgi:hypothetical protein
MKLFRKFISVILAAKKHRGGSFIFSALLTCIITLFVTYFDRNISFSIILIYSSILFLLILIHEILRDLEDIRMDITYRFRTVPIILGINRTQKIILILKTIIGWLMLLHISITYNYLWIKATYSSFGHLLFVLSLIVLPVLAAVYLLLFEHPTNYSRLRLAIKLIIITGIFSIIF